MVEERLGGQLGEAGADDVEDELGDDLGGRVLLLEGDDALTVGVLQGGVHRVVGVHAEGVVVGVDRLLGGGLDDFEVGDHVAGIQRVGFDDNLDAARVAVREAAGVGMLGELVAALNLEGLADAVGHRQTPRRLPKRRMWRRSQ